MLSLRSRLAPCFALTLAACSGATEPVTAPLATATASAVASTTAPVMTLPVPTRREEVVEELHGQRIVDPYRWLEDGDSADVAAWTKTQNEHTQKVLSAVPERAALRARIDALLRAGWVGAPAAVGSKKPGPKTRYFFRKQSPTQDQPVLYVREGGSERVLVDPNGLARDGTVALDYWVPSPKGRLVAYGTSSGGDEQSTLRVRDVSTGQDHGEADVIPRARYASVAWLPDETGFYYTRYPEPGSVPKGEEVYHRKVFFHTLGKPWRDDPEVFGAGRKMTDSPGVDLSPNGRWLVASVHMGWSRREAYLLDRSAKVKPGDKPVWVPLAVPTSDAVYDVSPQDDHLIVRTNDGAPTYQVFRVDPKKPERSAWKLLVPASQDVIQHVAVVGGDLFVTANRDAHSVVRQHAPDGKLRRELPLPMLGTVQGVSGEHDGAEAFFDFTSFTVPAQVHRVDVKKGSVELWAEVKPPVDPSEFLVEQRKVRSKDGKVDVPYFVVRKKSVAEDGKAPALLHAYGGFNISILPAWSAAKYVFLERGGVTVTANLRGGGEYGEAWHQAGMFEKKQNVFDDFYSVAEALVATKVTTSARLGILGGSNGGLLIGAAITQRPELFKAGVSLVPLLDMLRYHRFRIAKLWIPEYGSAENAKDFEWLRAYSPYHNVKPGVAHPAVLFATAEGDSRVDPLHARKMAALMQYEHGRAGIDRNVLLRVEEKAGHGAGKPVSKKVDEQLDVYSFLLSELGMLR